jgi:hypothetical protein
MPKDEDGRKVSPVKDEERIYVSASHERRQTFEPRMLRKPEESPVLEVEGGDVPRDLGQAWFGQIREEGTDLLGRRAIQREPVGQTAYHVGPRETNRRVSQAQRQVEPVVGAKPLTKPRGFRLHCCFLIDVWMPTHGW